MFAENTSSEKPVPKNAKTKKKKRKNKKKNKTENAIENKVCKMGNLVEEKGERLIKYCGKVRCFLRVIWIFIFLYGEEMKKVSGIKCDEQLPEV